MRNSGDLISLSLSYNGWPNKAVHLHSREPPFSNQSRKYHEWLDNIISRSKHVHRSECYELDYNHQSYYITKCSDDILPIHGCYEWSSTWLVPNKPSLITLILNSQGRDTQPQKNPSISHHHSLQWCKNSVKQYSNTNLGVSKACLSFYVHIKI